MFGLSAGAVLMLGAAGGMAISAATSDDPDTSGQEGIARDQAALGREQLAWNKEMYNSGAADRAAATHRANLVSDAQIRTMDNQTALANEYADYQRTTFRPLEQGIVKDAEAYDTPERREAAATAAKADVESNMAVQRGIGSRNLSRMGVNPSSGKSLDMNNQMAISGAALQAGASNTARTQVETMGHARKMDAASLGRNLASNQATAAGLSITAGNSAAQNGQLPVANSQAGIGLVNQGYGGAQNGLSNSAQTYGSILTQQQKQASDDSAMWASIGSAAVKAYASDVNLKEDIQPVDPEQALQAVQDTPVSNWAYKKGTAPDDGGQPHTGPMAQDVQKTMGNKVAPGGKKIDVISMMGTQMAAIQGLNNKLNKVMASQGLPA